MEDLFLKIIAREIPADIIYEDEYVIAFNDISPQAPVHFLVVPKKKIRTLNDIADEDQALVGRMIQTAGKLGKKMGFAEDGYRTVFNCNEYGGQTVFHIHLHVLAGKPLGWPPYQETLKQPVEQ
ncbi:MAG: histidine triad nucleotide-binding protein [Marinobacterium sp.]|nr:histidine triad nucleotide-binding protein [Marinobacterium sp.]